MGDRLHPRLIFSNYKYITVDRCVLLWASSNEHMHGYRLRGELALVSLNHSMDVANARIYTRLCGTLRTCTVFYRGRVRYIQILQ